MQAELDALAEADVETGRLEKEDRALLADYRQAARALTEARVRLAERFETGMVEQLKDLGMEKTEFRVGFLEPAEGEKKPMPRPEGDDLGEFLISPNPGEPLKPLARIASGGELSRIMLAMKALEAEGKVIDVQKDGRVIMED
jgi:DNA repair protein RecN (Recombination protein N)